LTTTAGAKAYPATLDDVRIDSASLGRITAKAQLPDRTPHHFVFPEQLGVVLSRPSWCFSGLTSVIS
jgi:hypothetical protein